jgi:hypothetical protein
LAPTPTDHGHPFRYQQPRDVPRMNQLKRVAQGPRWGLKGDGALAQHWQIAGAVFAGQHTPVPDKSHATTFFHQMPQVLLVLHRTDVLKKTCNAVLVVTCRDQRRVDDHGLWKNTRTKVLPEKSMGVRNKDWVLQDKKVMLVPTKNK